MSSGSSSASSSGSSYSPTSSTTSGSGSYSDSDDNPGNAHFVLDLSSSTKRPHRGVGYKEAKRDKKVMEKRKRILTFLRRKLNIAAAAEKKYVITRQEVMLWHIYSAIKKLFKLDVNNVVEFHVFNDGYDHANMHMAMHLQMGDSDEIELLRFFQAIHGQFKKGTRVKPVFKFIVEEYLKERRKSGGRTTVFMYTDGTFKDHDELIKYYKRASRKIVKKGKYNHDHFGCLILISHEKGVGRKKLKHLDSDEGQIVSEGHDLIDIKDCLRVSTEPYRLISMARNG